MVRIGCLASSNSPILTRMIFCSWVIVLFSVPGAGGRTRSQLGENPRGRLIERHGLQHYCARTLPDRAIPDA
jgi:hypothetical protein